jgi:hypothetical protein
MPRTSANAWLSQVGEVPTDGVERRRLPATVVGGAEQGEGPPATAGPSMRAAWTIAHAMEHLSDGPSRKLRL